MMNLLNQLKLRLSKKAGFWDSVKNVAGDIHGVTDKVMHPIKALHLNNAISGNNLAQTISPIVSGSPIASAIGKAYLPMQGLSALDQVSDMVNKGPTPYMNELQDTYKHQGVFKNLMTGLDKPIGTAMLAGRGIGKHFSSYHPLVQSFADNMKGGQRLAMGGVGRPVEPTYLAKAGGYTRTKSKVIKVAPRNLRKVKSAGDTFTNYINQWAGMEGSGQITPSIRSNLLERVKGLNVPIQYPAIKNPFTGNQVFVNVLDKVKAQFSKALPAPDSFRDLQSYMAKPDSSQSKLFDALRLPINAGASNNFIKVFTPSTNVVTPFNLAKSGELKPYKQYKFIHYSRNRFKELRPLTYHELSKDRATGRWAGKPAMVKSYIHERKNGEDSYRKRLLNAGIKIPKNQSFLYATMPKHENFKNRMGLNRHRFSMSDKQLKSSLFDVVGLPEKLLNPEGPQVGRKGLEEVLSLWKNNKKQLKAYNYMGMKIYPRIEVITPGKYKPYRIEKVAADDGELKPYQQRVVNRISQPGTNGLVVAHGVGSGKSRSSIAAYQKLKMPTNVIVPASLRSNYEKELTKWLGKVPNNVNIMSQQGIARNGMGPSNGLEIIDEGHRARDLGTQLHAELAKSHPKKRLLLSGTPIVNSPTDLSTLINLAAQKNVLPETEGGFAQRFVDYKKVNPGIIQRLGGLKPGLIPQLKNQNELGKILKKYVDYYPGSKEGFPSSREEIVKVPLGQKQMDVYRTIMNQAPWMVRQRVRYGLPPGRGELHNLQAFLTGPRQVSNSNREFVSNRGNIQEEKIKAAFKFLQSKIKDDPNYKAVVYSNYIGSGINPYKSMLEKSHTPYGEYTGDINRKTRDQAVKDYNTNKLRALLISGSGAEGLDLKRTSLIQLLNPSWNSATEKQVIGRGIRYGSHKGLPPSKQNVLIQRYLAQPQAGFLDRMLGRKTVRGVDEYVYNTARQKDLLNDQVIKLLAQQQN